MKLKAKYVIITLGLLILIPIIINYVIFNNNTYSAVDNNGWASFLGSYIGGSITLVGVVITILNQNKENEKALEYNKNEALNSKRL